MPFYPVGYALAFAITKDPRLSLIGGLLGNNPAGVVLIAAAAGQGRLGGGGVLGPPAIGAGPQRVQVPELPDDLDQAKAVLEARGLVPATDSIESEEPIDGVIGSDPPAESIVRLHSTVTILVSAGLSVPDVTGKDADEAEKTLRTASFDVERQSSKKSGKEDTVADQDPKGGTFADSGSVVTIEIYQGRVARLRAAEPEGGE